MFTGLVEDVGVVASVRRQSDAVVLTIRPNAIPVAELSLGDSVAINGVCLTVTETASASFCVLAGRETLGRTTTGELRAQSKVNLERALRVGDRLGGHMVAGHVDAVAQIASRRDMGANIEYSFRPPRDLMRYVVEKGSVAVDGISLTVNRADDSSFAVALIPHTVKHTNLGDKSAGHKVNIEVDIIGKYVERLLGGYTKKG